MYDKSHNGALSKLVTYSLVGLAHGESPAVLKGEATSSRATKGPPSRFMKEVADLSYRLNFPRDSLNVCQAANPSVAVRQVLSSGGKQSFSMAVLPMRASLCRSSWIAAEVSIGNGLARPELFISSLNCQVKKICAPIYKYYSCLKFSHCHVTFLAMAFA